MGKLVAVYGDQVKLEEALSALQGAGLADSAHVVGDGYVEGADGSEREGGRADELDERQAEPGFGERIVIPPHTGAGSPPASPAVLAPLAVPPGGSRAVGVVGDSPGQAYGTGDMGTTRDLETLTGGDSEEARHYANVLNGGGSLLVVEGDAETLDRAEHALGTNAGQGMVRH